MSAPFLAAAPAQPSEVQGEQLPASPPPQSPAECAQGISAANARTIFEALRSVQAGDGCVLEGVQTTRTRAQVGWVKQGQQVGPFTLAPTGCVARPTAAGQVLSIVAPPEAATACPGALAAMEALVRSESFGGLVVNDESDARSPFPAWGVAGLVGLLLAAGLLVLWSLRRRRLARAAGPQTTAARPGSR